jgi:hypothetical protein
LRVTIVPYSVIGCIVKKKTPAPNGKYEVLWTIVLSASLAQSLPDGSHRGAIGLRELQHPQKRYLNERVGYPAELQFQANPRNASQPFLS